MRHYDTAVPVGQLAGAGIVRYQNLVGAERFGNWGWHWMEVEVGPVCRRVFVRWGAPPDTSLPCLSDSVAITSPD